MSQISENLEMVRRKVSAAAKKCGRDPASVNLLAVSKKKPAEAIREAYATGQRLFGENYVQEFREKAEELSDLEIEWHFIGHLQRNKVKYILPIVRKIHSLNSLRLAEEIEKRADKSVDCLIEINLGGEDSKTGLAKAEFTELLSAIDQMKNINVTGLMTMPPFDIEPEAARPYFKDLKKIFDEFKERYNLTDLSMGMTGDMEVAIEEGSTIVRVGTAIFGSRV